MECVRAATFLQFLSSLMKYIRYIHFSEHFIFLFQSSNIRSFYQRNDDFSSIPRPSLDLKRVRIEGEDEAFTLVA